MPNVYSRSDSGPSQTQIQMDIINKRRQAESLARLQDQQTFINQSNEESIISKPESAVTNNQYAAGAAALQLGAQTASSAGAGSPITGTLTGAASGAAMGGILAGAEAGGLTGPQGAVAGAAIGAGVGVVGGLLQQSADRKRRIADAKARSLENISNAQANTENVRQNAMTNMVAALRSAFTGWGG